ncbi:hypothetical protein LTR84_001851 [Exophiala bonariae]|uniref:Acyltransferase 3 domain-containing protein n=1 Tax=Exophiala bonariae TaxID=1690606 RepID=A0AAV9NE01_9EURO|nr:hypothetical protein LTR84_001851 [Exophiala bonariae]
MTESEPFLYSKLEADDNEEQTATAIPLEDHYHDDPALTPRQDHADLQRYVPRTYWSLWRDISEWISSRVEKATYVWPPTPPTTQDVKQALIQALPRLFRPTSLRKTFEPGPTAYLDALRGYAAWNVFLAHGYKGYHFWYKQQPFLSALMAGEAMVALFFVISGYVLSYRLLIYTRNRSGEMLLVGLASSTFRRGIRLYGSTIVALFAALILVRLRLYTDAGKGNFYFESMWIQLNDWFWTLFYFLNPFSNQIWGYYKEESLQNKYLGQMWTIPVELRGSMILFIYIAATCKLPVYTRIALTCLLVIVSHYWMVLYVAQFLMGMLIAEFALLRYPERLTVSVSLTEHRNGPREQSVASKCFWTLVFIVGLFLLGQPDEDTNTLGIFGDWPWALLRSWLPNWLGYGEKIYWYLGFGSFFLILGLEMYPTLQVPLRWGWSQYVGELSFGIYALHVPLIFTITIYWWDPKVRVANEWGDGWGVLPGALVIHVAVFTCADYFNRIDKRVVRLGRWIQEQCFERWEKL